jgi:hypothetical protein
MSGATRLRPISPRYIARKSRGTSPTHLIGAMGTKACALYSIDRGTRDPRPSSQSSATGCSRHHARSASVPVFVRFHAFHLSFTPVPSTVHTNIQFLYCHHCYSPITLSPSFLRERRPSRLQSLPFSPLRRRRHAVTPLARSQP